MDLKFLGITDIVIVLIVLGLVVLGAKKGLLTKLVSISSGLIGLILSFVFCGQFKDFLMTKTSMGSSIRENILANLQKLPVFENPNASVSDYLSALGLPKGIADFLSAQVGDITGSNVSEELANGLTNIVMAIAAFFILLIGIWLLAILLKIVIKILRTMSIVRFVDGVLGVVGGIFLSVIIVYGLLAILAFIMPLPSMKALNDFMIIDMQLNTDSFRLSKYLYNNNIVVDFFKIFF